MYGQELSYLENKQMDPLLFFDDLYTYCMGDGFRNTFNFKRETQFECDGCSHIKTISLKDYEKEAFIILQSSNKNVKFKDMFGIISNLNDYKCDICMHHHQALVQNTQYVFQNNCLILKFKIVGNNHQFIDLDIEEFHENHIVIPGDKDNNCFIVKAAIIFKPNDPFNVELGGHYVCVRRINSGEGWLEISDTNSTLRNKFDTSLKGVYLLFLEKKILNHF